MAVNLAPPADLRPVQGVSFATRCAGIKQNERDDLVLVCLDPGSTVVGVFTRSAFAAPPVQVARERLAEGAPVRALVINSGNANAATGPEGREDAQICCAAAAEALGVQESAVLPFSTGVIGERLPVPAITDCLSEMAHHTRSDGWRDAAHAIMTTDTIPKSLSRSLDLDGEVVVVTGMAKGSGMICPDMATMLAYVATDAGVSEECLKGIMERANAASFSRITVDGDTSTNDAFVLIATGAAKAAPIETPDDPRHAMLETGITEVSQALAQAVIRDAEGATRFVTVRVEGGGSSQECLAVAYTIAHSPLVKTALFAGDANWGRFCMAIGRAGVPDLEQDQVGLWLDDVCVARHGMIAPEYTEAAGAAVMAKDEFVVRVDLGRGSAAETVWTSDLSYDYVRINAEYRT